LENKADRTVPQLGSTDSNLIREARQGDDDAWQRLLDLCGDRPLLPTLAPVWPLTSLRLAMRLHHEVPGIVVPADLLADLEAAGANAARIGRERARTMLREAPEHAAGVYLIAPFKRPEAILDLLDEST